MLIDLNMDLLEYCAKTLNINTPYAFSSTFGVKAKGTRRLLQLVQSVGGKEYLTGLGSKDYLDEEEFRLEGIKLIWQQHVQLIYRRPYGEFEPNLSVVDYFFSTVI